MAEPRRIEKPVQLLVEGRDQENVFEAFARHLALGNMQVQNFGGVDELRGFLRAFVRIAGFDTVAGMGIVRDAETSAASAFRSVRSSLENAGLPAPSRAGERAGSRPAVTVFILPGGAEAGMLETLLCRSFAAAPVNRCIDDFFGCVDRLRGASIDRRDKARAHAYLATKRKPPVSVGVAALRGDWHLEHEVFADVRAFLKSL